MSFKGSGVHLWTSPAVPTLVSRWRHRIHVFCNDALHPTSSSKLTSAFGCTESKQCPPLGTIHVSKSGDQTIGGGFEIFTEINESLILLWGDQTSAILH